MPIPRTHSSRRFQAESVSSLSQSSFDFSSELTPVEYGCVAPPASAVAAVAPTEDIENKVDGRLLDPLFASLGRFRVTQYKEELEALVKTALNSDSDAYGGVSENNSSHPLIWTAAMLLLSFACYLPMAFYTSPANRDIFIESHLTIAINTRAFRQALAIAIGCGLPKLLDLLSLFTERSLRGASGCNVVLNLLNLCFTLPNIILLLLPRYATTGKYNLEVLFICILQSQTTLVAIIATWFYTANLAVQTDVLSIRALNLMVLTFSVCGAFANTTPVGSVISKRWWIVWQVLRCIAVVWYLAHIKVFIDRLRVHKAAIGEGKLMHINFHFGVFLHAVIICSVGMSVWPIFFRNFYAIDYNKDVCTALLYLRAAIVVVISFAPFHLARMEKARFRQLLRERIESVALSWLQA